MRQTLALMIDAYRELNAKKLFWIAIALSLLLCVLLAIVGFTDKGLTIVGFQTGLLAMPDDPALREQVYGDLFYYIGFKVWLTFGATILALISTAGVFPDLIREGSIDLLLSKPIGRLRLFLTKWLTGLMFATLQIVVFTLGCFTVIGLRGGVWMPEMFWGIPLVVAFYSYLFAVCVLVGVLSRSTITALLVTILFWLPLIGLEFAERTIMLPERIKKTYIVQNLEENGLDAYADRDMVIDPFSGQPLEMQPPSEERLRQDLDAERRTMGTWRKVHRITYGIKAILPKTGETTGFLRKLMYPDIVEEENAERAQTEIELFNGYSWDRDLFDRVRDDLTRTRGPVFVIGTSLLFELVVLGLAAWVFCRRDY